MKTENLIETLFGSLDFKAICQDVDFKEDSVREIIILPILKALGFKENTNIIRSKTLQHPFLKIGSNKKIPIRLIPDYLLKIENNFVCALDAKSPSEKIINGENVEQVYSYAIHPEICSNYFALCNGIEFSLFKMTDPKNPIMFFEIFEIEHYWDKLAMYLSPNSFHAGKQIVYDAMRFVVPPPTKTTKTTIIKTALY